MKIFYLPDLGEGLAEGEIHEWHVKEGDEVKLDQPLVSMETAKAVVEVPSPETGRIKKLYGKKGDIIKTHAPLVEFEGGDEKAKDKGTVVGALEESSTLLDEGDIIVGAAKQTKTNIKAMPAVRGLAKELNVDLNLVTASGRDGQITADDVKKFANQKKSLPGKVEVLHGVRRVMATTMMQSHQEVVPVTIMDEADISALSQDADITVRLIQAIVAGAKKEPSLNAWYDGKNMERCLLNEVHLGLAVDTEEGLFVPVIKNAEKCSASECREKINQFKKSVKARTITPSDLHGASITLSNFGMIAGRYANPIIVPPAVAIVGSGRLRDEPRVVQGKIEIRRILPLSLTFDHRAVTGGEATRFLGEMINALEAKT